MHLTAAYMILKRNYLNIYFQCGAGISSISDQILSKYSDSTTLKLYPGAQNHEYYRSVFFSGLAGFKMETNIYKKRLFFDLQVNYIRESVRRNYYTNSSNRITFDIGLIWKFKLKRWQ